MPLRRLPPTTKLLLSGLASVCFATATTVFLSINLLRATVEREAFARVDSNMRVAEQLLNEAGPVTVLSNGKLFAGSTDLRNNGLVDAIQALVGGIAAILQDDRWLSTTILTADGTPAIGMPLADLRVRETVLAQHRPYRGLVDVLGTQYYAAYDPILDTEGAQVGMLFVGLQVAAVQAAITRTQGIILIVSAAIAFAGGVVLSRLGGKLAAQIAARQQQLEQAHLHLDTALASMANGLALWDRSNTLILANGRLSEVLALPAGAIVAGMGYRTFLQAQHDAGILGTIDLDEAYRRRIANIEARQPVSHFNTGNDGRTIHVQVRPADNDGWIATYEDVTERKMAEDRVAFMAEHDGLTGLANRPVFQACLQRLRDDRASFALLLLDLDDFKKVNDRLGHPVGDGLLQAAALRLEDSVRDGDLVARLGGDEFAIIQVGGALPADAAALAARVVKAMCQPFQLDQHEVTVGASCGIALHDAASPGIERLLTQADVALYAAKSAGRSTFRCFDASMDADLLERESFEDDLRKALAREQFGVVYQPLVDVRHGRVSSFEALLRWHHPTRGVVSPAKFIPVAEATGLIDGIGAWVLCRACLDATAWPANIRVAVNLSALQFQDDDLVAAVRGALRESGLQPDRLELEITESALLHDVAKVSQTLHTLRALGVRIAMDDFGTGYSSLSYLQSFPFDKIKIDQSFVRGLDASAGSGAIVRAVTTLADSLGMETVAEGVETAHQFDRVCAEGCSEVQGYLFSKPRPAHDIAAMLACVHNYFQPEVEPTQAAPTFKRAALDPV